MPNMREKWTKIASLDVGKLTRSKILMTARSVLDGGLRLRSVVSRSIGRVSSTVARSSQGMHAVHDGNSVGHTNHTEIGRTAGLVDTARRTTRATSSFVATRSNGTDADQPFCAWRRMTDDALTTARDDSGVSHRVRARRRNRASCGSDKTLRHREAPPPLVTARARQCTGRAADHSSTVAFWTTHPSSHYCGHCAERPIDEPFERIAALRDAGRVDSEDRRAGLATTAEP